MTKQVLQPSRSDCKMQMIIPTPYLTYFTFEDSATSRGGNLVIDDSNQRIGRPSQSLFHHLNSFTLYQRSNWVTDLLLVRGDDTRGIESRVTINQQLSCNTTRNSD